MDFCKMFANKYFNFSEQNSDPFLIQTSIFPKKNVAAGSGLRALKTRKSTNEGEGKIILPLNEAIITKAKACQEMLMYEKENSISYN